MQVFRTPVGIYCSRTGGYVGDREAEIISVVLGL